MASIDSLVKEWLRLDKNPTTRLEIEKLYADQNVEELEKRLRKRISFGTAGLRSSMEAGFSRMNDLTVIQASQGLCMYLLDVLPTSVDKGVVIGHDHRHNSERFARLTAAAFLKKGFRVYFYRELVHTPLVPFGVKKLEASCGIMITASHNPKKDNGYKVYWENACQIVPPHDKGISQSISVNLEPWTWDAELVNNSPLCIDNVKEISDAYFEELKAISYHSKENISSKVKFVYTAMHGVGTPVAKRAFETFSLNPFISAKEQEDPDPDFSTVAFPNPEEGRGALAIAMKTADENNAEVIFANDPDADRFSVSEKQKNGEWILFSGDQIGVMLASAVLENYKAHGKPINKLAMLASTVSSKMLKKMAKDEGFYFEETLTGFKWLGNKAIDLTQQGYEVLFAYEEAIGYMIDGIVRDKDGISALVTFAELVVQLNKRGLTISEYLDELYKKYGYFVTETSYFICHSPETIDKIFNKLRFGENPVKSSKPDYLYPYQLSYPSTLSGHKITYIRDLTIGYDTSKPDNQPILPTSKSSHMITFGLENGCNLTLRTSGTEPKIKYYLELSGKDKKEVGNELRKIAHGVSDELLEPEKYGLGYKVE
ncbi:5364_t:CDS:10 [Funneliformis mosseae]|uniref:5364_t:CDS:1 n=1 Tax=Funneliformis mosseae TaxID=27381 RepID=A0A9N8ZZG9_FUNMO|nr:5364_t:CDS:10 [Funneliformis mosseae]